MKKVSAAAAKEEAKRAVARASVMAAALKRREDELEQLVREQSKYRALMVVRKRAHRRIPYCIHESVREHTLLCREGNASERRHLYDLNIPTHGFSFLCPLCACACPVQITRACRDRDRSLLSLGWSRLRLRAIEGVSAVGVTTVASARGQAAGEAAVVARNSEDVRHTATPTAAKEQGHEEAISNYGLTENRRQGPENEMDEAREQQERRTKRLVSEQRLCTVDSQRFACVP